MAPWTISAVRNGDVQEPSQFPYKQRAAEQILNDAWTRHADSKSSVNSKTCAIRHHVGLSRFQFGDGEYQASIAAFQKYHEKKPEDEPLPEMQELVQATRTMSRSVRTGNFVGAGQGQGGAPQLSLASLRRRHSTGDHFLLGSMSNPGRDCSEAQTAVEELSELGGDDDDDDDDGYDDGDGGDDKYDYRDMSGRVTAALNESGAEEHETRSYEYGRSPTLLSITTSVPVPSSLGGGVFAAAAAAAAAAVAPTIPRRQSHSNHQGGFDGGGGNHRGAPYPGRLGSVDALVREASASAGGTAGPVSVGGGDDTVFGGGGGGDGSGVRYALLAAGRESAPGKPSSSRLYATDLTGGGNGGRRSHCGGAATLHRPAERHATMCVLTPPPALPAAPPSADPSTSTDPSAQPTSAAEGSPLDRVNQMLHDLRLMKRPDPSGALAAALGGSGGARQQRQNRAAAAGTATAGSAGGEACGGGRLRRSSCTVHLDVTAADSGPRLFGSASRPKREACQCPPPLRFQAAAGSPSSPSSLASPRQGLTATELSPGQSRQASGALHDSWDDEVLVATRSGQSASAGCSAWTPAAATTAAAPPQRLSSSSQLSHPNIWSLQPLPLPSPPPPSEALLEPAAAAAVGPPEGRNLYGSPVVPFRSKSQMAFGQSLSQTRASGGGPLGGWTGRPTNRKSAQLSPSGAPAAAAAAGGPCGSLSASHNVHFAAVSSDAGLATQRTFSETSMDSSQGCATGDEGYGGNGSGGGGPARLGSISSGQRFIRASGNFNASGSAGGGGGGGGGGGPGEAVAARASMTSESSIGHLTPRPPDQGPAGYAGPTRPMGRSLGGLFGAPRRDSSGGLKHHL